MPVWASILVAVIAAFASGGFGAWLGTWNDRHERFRDRLIEAADELVGEASAALIAIRDGIGAVKAGAPATAKMAVEGAWASRDRVLRRSARVDLLFGPGSETARAATNLIAELAKACAALTPPLIEPGCADQALVEATGHLTSFERAAFEGIRVAAPPSASLGESVRRALSR